MTEPLPDLWNAPATLSEPELLLFRSHLLGADLRLTNFGGGNTSAKIRQNDPLTGAPVDVLWVKGSGGDLGSMGLDGFATLYLDKLTSLTKLYRGVEFEDEMVGYLPHCAFNLNSRPASIDTPLHGLLPFRHVDHIHPDAVIAIAAAREGERWTREIFGPQVGWLPWLRPGFELGLRLQRLVAAEPELRGVVLGGHGVIYWGNTAVECYRNGLDIVNRAMAQLSERAKSTKTVFGGPSAEARTEAERTAFVAELVPILRGKVSRHERKVAHFDAAPGTLQLVNSKRAAELAAAGTSCPDHFLRTKQRPLWIDCEPTTAPTTVAAQLDHKLSEYSEAYAAYYQRCRTADSPPMRDPLPVVVLIRGVGMLTFAKDKTTARLAAEFYANAIEVMRGATLLTDYVGLPEREAFRIEYWALEEAKLRRQPPERSLARRIALITGGAGGIGRACARRLLRDGAAVVLLDIDAEALETAHTALGQEFGADQVRSLVTDVTSEAAVDAAVRHAVLEFGGLDLVVCSAGLASAAAIEDTTLATWQRSLDVLTTGYFLVARAAFRVMRAQGLGGSIVFVASKNALAASPQASAYCTAKAAELHLARCLALEGAPLGIRVNSVNPDAVLQDSKIWSGEWRQQRAASYQVAEDQLEEVYRKRSLLQRSVFPADIAEAVAFFASEASAKSTGNILNVDAGNAAAFPR